MEPAFLITVVLTNLKGLTTLIQSNMVATEVLSTRLCIGKNVVKSIPKACRLRTQ